VTPSNLNLHEMQPASCGRMQVAYERMQCACIRPRLTEWPSAVRMCCVDYVRWCWLNRVVQRLRTSVIVNRRPLYSPLSSLPRAL